MTGEGENNIKCVGQYTQDMYCTMWGPAFAAAPDPPQECTQGAECQLAQQTIADAQRTAQQRLADAQRQTDAARAAALQAAADAQAQAARKLDDAFLLADETVASAVLATFAKIEEARAAIDAAPADVERLIEDAQVAVANAVDAFDGSVGGDIRADPFGAGPASDPDSAYSGRETDPCDTSDTEADGGYCGADDPAEALLSGLLQEPSLGATPSDDSGALPLEPSPSLAPGAAGWGLATQQAKSLRDSRFPALGVSKLRRTVPYDIVLRTGAPTACGSSAEAENADELSGLRSWISSAGAADITISFDHCKDSAKYGQLPSVDEYKRAVRAFRTEFPQVRSYVAWNEPNHADQPTSVARRGDLSGARQAALYWRSLNKACDNVDPDDAGLTRCRAVAGEFVDNVAFKADYFNAYKNGLAGRRPAFWAFHTYSTGKYRSLAAYRKFADHLPATRSGAAPQVWLTEAGGVYRVKAEARRSDSDVEGDLRYLLNDLLDSDAKIKRFYYYAWTGAKGAAGFDSALINPETNRQRGIFKIYRSRTNPSS